MPENRKLAMAVGLTAVAAMALTACGSSGAAATTADE